MDEEAWLRRLLDACHHALSDLRERKLYRSRDLVSELEQVCGRLQRKLNDLGSRRPPER